MRTKYAPFLRYGIAVAAVAVALALILLLRPLIAPNFLFILLAAAVITVTYAGLGPGLFAALLSIVLAEAFLFPPERTSDFVLTDVTLFVIFSSAVLAAYVVYRGRQKAQESLETQRDQLQILHNATKSLGEAITLEQVAEVIVSVVYDAVDAHTGVVCRMLPDGQTLEMLNRRHLPEETYQKYRLIPMNLKGPLTDAIQSNQPIFIETFEEYVARYPQFEANIRQNGSKATACFPLLIKGRAIGGLTISFAQPKTFTQDTKELLLAIAQQCVQALDRAQHYADERAARERLRVTLASIGDAMISTDALGQIIFMNPVAEALTGWTSAEAIGKQLNDVFHIISAETREPAESPYEKVVQTGAIVGLANHTLLITRDGNEIPIDDSGAPISDEDGRTEGIILVFRDISERRRAEARMAGLQRLTSAFSGAITVNEIANIVITQGLAELEANRGAIRLLNEGGTHLELISHHNFGTPMWVMPMSDNYAATEAARSQQPLWFEDMTTYAERFPQTGENAIQAEIGSFVTLPLTLNAQVMGTLTVAFSEERQFSDEDRAFMIAIAQQCAQALDRARLYEAERTARERLAFLSSAGSVLVSSLDYDTTLKHIARLAVPRIADWCSVDLLDEAGKLQQLMVAHTDEGKEELVSRFRESRMGQIDENSLSMIAMRTRQTQVIPEVTQEMIEAANPDAETRAILDQLNLCAAMTVPLFAQGKPLGVIGFGNSDSGRSFGAEDIRVGEALAQRAAMAIENARLYREAYEEHERLRVTLASIGDAVIVTDINGNIIFINAVAEALTGWTAADAAEKPLHEVFRIINQESRQPVESPFDKVIQTGAIVGLANHTFLLRRDGGEVPVDDSGAPIRDENGEIVGVILVFRDISERHRAEIYSAGRQHLIAAFAEAATMQQIAQLVVTRGITALGGDMAIVMMLNRDRTALEPLAHHNFPPKLLADFPLTPLNEPYGMTDAIRNAQPLWIESQDEYTARYPHFSDRMREEGLQAFAFVPLLMHGSVAGVLCIIFRSEHEFDEVERIHILSLAAKCGLALERAEMFEAEQHARLEAEEANQLKMRFLGMISHELRTPLTSIKGFATTLLATDVKFDSDQQQKFIEVIDQEADKLTELIDQLLDLTRVHANTLTITPVVCAFASVIDVARAQLDTLTREQNLVVHIPNPLPQVRVDAQRIAQVLVNLVSNAAKFSPPNTEIRVEARALDHFVEVRVCDHGLGIPAEAREYVFEAFRQIEGHGIQRKGAGLGLAISKALIEGHGGHIRIDDDPAYSTVIAFMLPTAE
jgi:PAS domain S-box-containing protein